MKTVKEVSALSGISVRTLHYYDKINLLKPTLYSETGYRYYDEAALEKLQQILFFKEFELPLKEIKAIMENTAFDKETTLKKQKRLLLMKKHRLTNLIHLIDDVLKGENTMSFKEFSQVEIEQLFQELIKDIREEQLQVFVKQYGGIEEYREAYIDHAKESKTQQNFKKMIEWYGNQEQPENNPILNSYQRRFDELFKRIADSVGQGCDESAVKKMIGEYEFVCKQLYQISDAEDLLRKQAELLASDETMTAALDQRYGEGSALAISRAIMNFYH